VHPHNECLTASACYGAVQYWDAHCSTVSKLPAIALLDPSSCPRGISDSDFLALLSRLTSLQQWQIWDLWNTLDVHGCGFVSFHRCRCLCRAAGKCCRSPQQQPSITEGWVAAAGQSF
jgi:hypothetical protein